jgi:hypothetical protein
LTRGRFAPPARVALLTAQKIALPVAVLGW